MNLLVSEAKAQDGSFAPGHGGNGALLALENGMVL